MGMVFLVIGGVPNITQTTAPLDETRLLKSSEAMTLLRFTDRGAFTQFVKSQGVPVLRLNARNFLYPEPALRAWMQRRTIADGRDAA
jgi:hypothetical protein